MDNLSSQPNFFTQTFSSLNDIDRRFLVARERFELSSRAPEAPMLDHYTTGLQSTPSKHGFYVITLTLRYSPFFVSRRLEDSGNLG
jgi:hypothetical protein